MKKHWSGLIVAGALAATAVLGAEAPQGGPNPANTPPADSSAPPGVQRAPAPPSAQARTPNTVTLTGCIQNAPPMAAAGPGQAAPGQATQPRFLLSNAQMAATGDSGRSAVGTSGTKVSTYQLDGETAAISTNVDHQVEVTGTLQSASASAAGSANAAQGSTAAGPTLRVTSVRMLSGTCEAEAKTPGTSGVTIPPAGDSAPSKPATPPEAKPEPRPEQEAPAPEPQR
jgi:hypothetical protein